jgi:hypothetical protein
LGTSTLLKAIAQGAVAKPIAQSDRFFATQFDISHLNTIVAKLRQNKD